MNLVRLLSVVAVTMCSCTQAATPYSFTVLDTLPIPNDVDPFGRDSLTYAINDLGIATGESTLDRTGAIGRTRPVKWTESGEAIEMWDNQTFGGIGLGINNDGFIVGRYGSGNTIPLPGPGIPPGGGFIWNPATREFSDLGDLGGANVEATDINNSRQVAGSSEAHRFVDINDVPTLLPVPRAFIWDETDGMQDLGTLDGGASRGTAINEQGSVVGWSSLLDGTDRAFIWDSVDGMQDLGISESRAFGINDLNDVVGMQSGVGGFLWSPTTGQQALIGISPNDINNARQVVGAVESIAGQLTAVLWEEDLGTIPLQELVSISSDWQLQIAHAINDHGQIVGTARYLPDGSFRGFLLTPIPEPNASTIALLSGMAVATFMYRLRKGSCHGMVSADT